MGIDKDIENLAKSYLPCLENKLQPAAAPLHPWIWPTTPWKRIHIDFAGPFLDEMFLVVVDAHSKWPEVIQMSSTTSFKTIEALRSLFAKYGLPEQLVSDNEPQFPSEELRKLMELSIFVVLHITLLQMGWLKGLSKLSKRATKTSAQDEPTLDCHSSCLVIDQGLMLPLMSLLENCFCNGNFVLGLIS